MQKFALYRKYRPENFDDIMGQEHIVGVLKNAVKENLTSHAYLFSGPRGTGKTSIARILAKAVNCQDKTDHNPCGKCATCLAIAEGRLMDLMEIDAASNRGIDEMRDLREKVKFAPTEGQFKVFIIDEVHMLTKEAFNALLKTLEEPPTHAIFILATTEINKVPATIISRCQRHDFKRIKLADLVTKLSKISKKEKITISDDALEMIAETSEGGLRDAESLLDQLSTIGLEKIEETDVENILGLAPHKTVADFITSLLEKDNPKALQVIEKASQDGVDLIIFTKSSIEFLRKLLSAKLGNLENIEGTKEQIEELKKISEQTEIKTIVEISEEFLWAQAAFKTGIEPKAILSILCAKNEEEKGSQIQVKVVSEAEPKVKQSKVVQKPNGKWQQFLMEIKSKNNTMYAFLRVASPEFTEDGLVLAFPYQFHKERIEETRNKRIVEEILTRVYGEEINIKCRLEGSGRVTNRASDLDTAVSILGGEVID